jgi:hypothetical protein
MIKSVFYFLFNDDVIVDSPHRIFPSRYKLTSVYSKYHVSPKYYKRMKGIYVYIYISEQRSYMLGLVYALIEWLLSAHKARNKENDWGSLLNGGTLLKQESVVDFLFTPSLPPTPHNKASQPEVVFLDVIGTTVFLLDIHSHFY